jgi:hypothetical protein
VLRDAGLGLIVRLAESFESALAEMATSADGGAVGGDAKALEVLPPTYCG